MARGNPILSAKLVGAETIVTDLRRYGQTIRAKLRAEVQLAGLELARKAASMAPKHTGALAASIRAVGQETETKIVASVGTDVKHGQAFYGRFLESGWTPNPRTKIVNTRSVFGAWGPAAASFERAGWKRNPRNAKSWRDWSRQHGKRKIYAYPFLKPALAQLRGTIRARLIAAVRGDA